ncbi:transporter substrate-binding domain-containing protein [Pseudonocardia sp. NPDC049154]|uniref:transporter substrate-binding domain-containing protein n=1 Tax=Pseudonocardia sp. NPDC049154 TaxID=3155501 RepID=UPI00340C8637
MRGALTTVAVGLVLALTACGSGTVTAPKPVAGVAPVPELIAQLPPELARTKVLPGASPMSTAPLYFLGEDAQTPTGLVIELIDNAAAHLGLTVEWRQIPYAGLVPAMSAGQVEVAGAQFSPTRTNLDAANIVTLYRSSTSLLTRTPDVGTFAEPLAVCGRALAVSRGSAPDLAVAKGLGEECGAAAQPPPTIQQFGSAGDAQVALRAGRVDAFVLSTASCQYAHDTYPQIFDIARKGEFSSRAAGVAFAKQGTALAELFRKAFQAGIDDGSSAQILARWGASDQSVPRAELNVPVGV